VSHHILHDTTNGSTCCEETSDGERAMPDMQTFFGQNTSFKGNDFVWKTYFDGIINNRNLLQVIYDRNIQAIVDKLFPNHNKHRRGILDSAKSNTRMLILFILEEIVDSSEPPAKKRKDSEDKTTAEKNEYDSKILLRLLPHPDENLRGNIHQLKKSVFNLKKSTKVQALFATSRPSFAFFKSYSHS
jgi:hypothetical protein